MGFIGKIGSGIKQGAVRVGSAIKDYDERKQARRMAFTRSMGVRVSPKSSTYDRELAYEKAMAKKAKVTEMKTKRVAAEQAGRQVATDARMKQLGQFNDYLMGSSGGHSPFAPQKPAVQKTVKKIRPKRVVVVERDGKKYRLVPVSKKKKAAVPKRPVQATQSTQSYSYTY